MFYHFLVPEGGHPIWEEHFIEKYQNASSFFLSHICILNQQKQREVISKNAVNIFPSNKYDFFPYVYYNLDIVLSYPLFEPITALLHLQVCDLLVTGEVASYKFINYIETCLKQPLKNRQNKS